MSHDTHDSCPAAATGTREALDDLFPYVYDDLRRRARAYLRGERQGHTLTTTALVNETYLKLIDIRRIRLQDRAHLMALASIAMRRVLVSHARAHQAGKRGGRGGDGDAALGELLDATSLPVRRADEMLALDRALDKLSTLNPRLSRTVELRFFGGLTVDEMADVLGVAPSTVKLDWQKARAWLFRELFST